MGRTNLFLVNLPLTAALLAFGVSDRVWSVLFVSICLSAALMAPNWSAVALSALWSSLPYSRRRDTFAKTREPT